MNKIFYESSDRLLKCPEKEGWITATEFALKKFQELGFKKATLETVYQRKSSGHIDNFDTINKIP